jgi:aminopeptidase N
MGEGFAHWAQLIAMKNATGRPAALDALNQREPALALRDSGDPADAQPLTTAYDEVFYRTKASFVWWMLADMIGEDKLMESVRAYSPERDREPTYFQKLLEQASHHDLEQFFDDWIYRDRGLPEFKITGVYTRQNLNGGYLVTVTVENSGNAGAEVAVLAVSQSAQNSTRIWVPAKGKASSRIVLPLQPLRIVVNDGGVPEIDPTDNVYTVPPKP